MASHDGKLQQTEYFHKLSTLGLWTQESDIYTSYAQVLQTIISRSEGISHTQVARNSHYRSRSTLWSLNWRWRHRWALVHMQWVTQVLRGMDTKLNPINCFKKIICKARVSSDNYLVGRLGQGPPQSMPTSHCAADNYAINFKSTLLSNIYHTCHEIWVILSCLWTATIESSMPF